MNIPNEKQDEDMSRIFNAIQISDINWVKEIVNTGDDIEKVDKYYYPGYSPLDLAAQMGNIEIISLLLEAGADVNYSEESSPLHMAISANNLDAVKILVSAGADLEFEIDDGLTSLMVAVMKGNMEIVKLLVKSGANFNAHSRYGSVSEIALQYGYPKISEYISSLSSHI